jgi:exodeoxyribonuclease VII large subunit
MLASLSYQSVLKRGFALVRDSEGRAVRSIGGLEAGSRVAIELTDGRAGASITSVESSSPERTEAPKPKRSPPKDQGSLF